MRLAKPNYGIFCAMRAWDQRAERGYMKRIEDEFLRLQPLPAVPLEYRLPARFETIPSKPISQALANTSVEA